MDINYCWLSTSQSMLYLHEWMVTCFAARTVLQSIWASQENNNVYQSILIKFYLNYEIILTTSIMQQNIVNHIKNYSFILEDLLGEGATGSVYLGKDMNNGKKVAIKIIEMKRVDNQVTKYLLNNQKKALTVIKHPNVLRALDIIQENQYCYIITEFCNQGTLEDLIKKKGKLHQAEAIHHFRNIVAGYQACAQHNVIHRDLKPSNILLHEGVCLVSDFGYCEIQGAPKPSMFYNVGSPSYMAPEAYVKNMYGVKSDIWALGVILYEMLVGKTFDQGLKYMQSIYKLKKQGLAYHQQVSNVCKSIISQCLNLDPATRIDLDKLINMIQNARQTLSHNSIRNSNLHVNPQIHNPQPQQVTSIKVIESSKSIKDQQNTVIHRRRSANENITKNMPPKEMLFQNIENQYRSKIQHPQVYNSVPFKQTVSHQVDSKVLQEYMPEKAGNFKNRDLLVKSMIFQNNVQRTSVVLKTQQNIGSYLPVQITSNRNNVMKKVNNQIVFHPNPQINIIASSPKITSNRKINFPEPKLIRSVQVGYPTTMRDLKPKLHYHS